MTQRPAAVVRGRRAVSDRLSWYARFAPRPRLERPGRRQSENRDVNQLLDKGAPATGRAPTRAESTRTPLETGTNLKDIPLDIALVRTPRPAPRHREADRCPRLKKLHCRAGNAPSPIPAIRSPDGTNDHTDAPQARTVAGFRKSGLPGFRRYPPNEGHSRFSTVWAAIIESPSSAADRRLPERALWARSRRPLPFRPGS